MSIYFNVEKLIQADKLEEAFDIILRKKKLDSDLRDEITHLKARYSRLKKEKSLGIANDQSELNQIRSNLISINRKYFSSGEKFTKSLQNLHTSQNNLKYLAYFLGLVILGLAILSIKQYDSIKDLNENIVNLKSKILTRELKIDSFNNLAIIIIDTSFSEVVLFDTPTTIWNKVVMIQAKEIYTKKIKFTFTGIKCVNTNLNELNTNLNIISAEVGDRFYFQRTGIDSSRWGVNVIHKEINGVKIELFPLTN